MSGKYLTLDEAVECCLEYWRGEKVRHIHGKRDVDPRRLYGVLDGQEHPGGRQLALNKLKALDPNLANLVETFGWRYRAKRAA